METQHLYIKNMVCPRCEIAVKSTFQKLDIEYTSVELGHAEIARISNQTFKILEDELVSLGFELIQNKDNITLEQIKLICQDYLDKCENQLLTTNLSNYLSTMIGRNYSALSKLFSCGEGMTIEQYFLGLKVSRVKQLLLEGLSLSEIAALLNYSSVQYLSTQFRKVEGCTVTEYMNRKSEVRWKLA